MVQFLAQWVRKLIAISLYSAIFTLMSIIQGLGSTTGLVIIPIAETVGAGQYNIQPQTFSHIRNLRNTIETLGTEIGIGNRLEAGIDFSFGHSAQPYPILNGKYLFASSKDGTRVAGVGLLNLQANRQVSPFVVGSNDLSVVRTHAGLIGSSGHIRWFAGLDRSLGSTIAVTADYTSGRENFWSVGVDYIFNPQTDLLIGLEFPNTPGDTILMLQYTLGNRYTRTAAKSRGSR